MGPMSPEKTIGFGIVGCGAIGRVHAAAIRSLPGARLVAVTGGPEAPARAQEWQCEFEADVQSLAGRADIDVVDICTPSGTRAEIVEIVAAAGKHVIVEKPIDVTLARADRVIEACRRAGVLLGCIFQARFNRTYRLVRDAVQRGRLGRPVMASAAVKWYRSQDYYAGAGEWRGTKQIGGGGALINQAIHSVDLLRWVMGEVERVSAFTATLARQIEVEDTAVVILRFGNGALGTIEATTAAYPGMPRRLELHGPKGSIVVVGDEITEWTMEEMRQEDYEIRASLEKRALSREGVADPTLTDISLHRAQLEDFVEAVRQGRPPAVDGMEGRKALELVVAAYRSAEAGGHPVVLPLTN
ncbi:MAG TPA: Gfo/Idh/MocA family oxidoreductase [Firmicutes bacterium]|nr:Gfo/Idh/MocA family oxidoreductase [Bacillota bacterium]